MALFKYSILRFVPDPMKGEFVNVGVIAGSDELEQWTVQQIQRTRRATAIMRSGSAAWSSVAAQIAELQAIVDDFSMRAEGLRAGPDRDFVSEEWLVRISEDYQNMLQLTSPMPISGNDIDEVVNQLWDILIHEPDARKNPVTKTIIRSSVVRLLRPAVTPLGGHIETNTTLKTARTHTPVDVINHNGRVGQIVQCYSFDVADLDSLLDDVKAWGWTMHNLRDIGGSIKAGKNDLVVDQGVRVDVVCFTPDRQDVKDAVEEANTVFGDHNVNATTHKYERREEIVEGSNIIEAETDYLRHR